ncbi:MAG: hypothetical protein LBG52_05625 [Candidatus Peribacteria bacterium]|nr:hypothetical protein [Candidatus Peribacteria bacterium]
MVNVGDEIEYIKNDKGFYVEKSKKDKQDEFMEKLEKALLTIEDMLKRIKALEEFQQKNANALQELKKRAGNG